MIGAALFLGATLSTGAGPAILAALEIARPVFLWGLALAVPLLLLHLHHRRRVVVPFLALVVESLGPRRPGAGWRRLRDYLPLALRLGALAAAVFALAGLAPREETPPPETLLVVIDADVTTSAVEADGRPRLAHGFDLAAAWARSAPWSAVAAIEARRAATPRLPLTRDAEEAARDLRAFAQDVAAGRHAPAPARVDLTPVLDLAIRRAAREGPAVVLVLTARDVRLPAALPPGVRVVIRGMGRADDDQSLVAFRVQRRAREARALVQVDVRNDAPGARRRAVRILVDGEPVGETTLDLEAGATDTAEWTVDVPDEGGTLDVRLEGADAMRLGDDVAAWLAPPLRPSVLVVHGGRVRPYTRAILEAMRDEIDLERSGTVAAADFARAGPRDVVIMDGVAVPRGSLAPGAWIFLAPLAGSLPFDVGPTIEEPLVWRTASDHPLVRDLDLALAYVARGQTVSGPGLVPLAEADGRAVLAEGERQGVRFVVLGLDPERSDLPVRAALPLLVRGAVRRLAAAPVRPLAPYYRVGEALRPRQPLPGGPGVRLEWAQGGATARLAREGEAFRVPAGARGHVRVVQGDEAEPTWAGRTAFVDLDPARRVPPVRQESPSPAPYRARTPAAVRWQRALLVLAAALLLLDVVLLALSPREARELAVARRAA